MMMLNNIVDGDNNNNDEDGVGMRERSCAQARSRESVCAMVGENDDKIFEITQYQPSTEHHIHIVPPPLI